jgi:DNA polymerase III alpha subunit
MNDILPIFKTHGSLGRSILTVEDEKELSESGPVSLVSIVKKHKLENITIIDDTFLCFPQVYSELNDITNVIFGINLLVAQNAKDKSEPSIKTENKVSILMRNSAGYKDLLKIHNLVYTNLDNFYITTAVIGILLRKIGRIIS